MADTRQQLRKAFELINKDQLEDAIAILKPITAAEPENADAWWLLANASSEPRDARRALVTVLKLDPRHAKARESLDKLNELFPPSDDELMMMMDIEEPEPDLPMATRSDFADADEEGDSPFKSEIDELFSTIKDDDLDFEKVTLSETSDDDDFGDDDDDPFASLLEEDSPAARRSRGGSRRRRRILLPLVAILAVVLVAAVVFMLMSGGEDEPTEPPESGLPTDPGELVALAPEAVPVETAPLLESVRVSAENDARTGVSPDASAVLAQLDQGSALVIKICTEPGPTLPTLARDGIRVAALRAGSTPDVLTHLGFVGVSVEDCQSNDTLYRAIAPIQAAVTFSSNTTNPEEAFSAFQQTWTVEN